MASNLERVGVLLVAEGISGFLGALGDAGAKVVGFLGDSINLAGDFEQTMNKLGAVSEATAEEIGLISDKAKALGADLTLPATSAVDAGNAMLELSKAGFTVQQTMDAAKGVLQLAAAATIDEAKAAEIAANAINAFGLAASDATFVADLLAATANASSVEITDVADSYKMAGAVFSNFQAPVVGAKQAMVDLTTAVGLLGNAGIKGSDAGTSLKQALLQLTGPSKKAKGLMIELARSIGETGDIAYTADGQMRSFPEILGLVARATKDLTDEKRNQYITDIFGADASRAILILMRQGPDAWAKMEAAVTREGAATDLATAQTKGFKGALEGAKSQIETLQLTIGEKFLPILALLLSTYISPAIAQLTAFTEVLFGNKEAFDQLSPTLQGVVTWLGNAQAAWGYWEKGIISTRTALDVLLPGLGQVAPIVEGVIAAFSKGGAGAVALGGYVDALKGRWEVLQGTTTNVVNGVLAVVLPVFGLVQTFLTAHGTEITTVITTAWNSINTIINKTLQIIGMVIGAGLATFGAWIVEHGDTIYGVMEATWGLIASVVTTTLNLISGIVSFVLSALEGDWEGAHDTLLNTSSDFVLNLINVITKGLDFIASFFGTSMQGILELWQGNWDMLVTIAGKIPGLVANVGGAIVRAIRDGFNAAWSGFISDAQAKLNEFRDMLPFSEPKDHSSPLFGLGKSGNAIVDAIQTGINLAPALTIPPPALPDLNELISGAKKGDKKGGAKVAPNLGTLIPDTKKILSNIPDTLEGIWKAMQSTDAFDTGRFNELNTAYNEMKARVSPPASAGQIAGRGGCNCGSNVTYNNNMPIYTNNTPAALTQSWAVLQASMP